MDKGPELFWKLYGWFGLARDPGDVLTLFLSGGLVVGVAVLRSSLSGGKVWIAGQAAIVQFSAWARFSLIGGEFQANWIQYEKTGEVVWTVHPVGLHGERRLERFLSEAKVAGRLLRQIPGVPTKFPTGSTLACTRLAAESGDLSGV
jgi:hypothetical protein